MPKPRAEESKDDFMGRCVPMMMDEGKDKDQAVAACMNVFETEKARDKSKDIIDDAIRGKKRS